MKKIITHVGYLAIFVLGAVLIFKGMEDLALAVLGQIEQAEITRVDIQSVRVGKRGRAEKHIAHYKFKMSDGREYKGSGDYEGTGATPERGQMMPILYLSAFPSVNAPNEGVVGPGLLLTLGGGFIAIATLTAWIRKITGRQGKNRSSNSNPRNSQGPQSADPAYRRRKGQKKTKK